MRVFLILPLSAALLGGCLTTQESPIYEQSTSYQGDLSTRHQYANAVPAAPAPTVVSYESAPAQPLQPQPWPVQTQPAPIQAYSPATTVMATAPTDSAYGARDVSGTPGFMAMQQSLQTETVQLETMQAAAQPLPDAQFVSSAPLGAAGTPIVYDYSRNLVSVDAATTGQRIPQSSRILPSVGQGIGQGYTVQQGDTVYSLSRQTCVGVNVIQSMNGLNTDYAIKIGQSITLPASVC